MKMTPRLYALYLSVKWVKYIYKKTRSNDIIRQAGRMQHTTVFTFYSMTYRHALLPDGERPAADTQHDVAEEGRPLQRVDWSVVDGAVVIGLRRCKHAAQVMYITTTCTRTCILLPLQVHYYFLLDTSKRWHNSLLA